MKTNSQPFRFLAALVVLLLLSGTMLPPLLHAHSISMQIDTGMEMCAIPGTHAMANPGDCQVNYTCCDTQDPVRVETSVVTTQKLAKVAVTGFIILVNPDEPKTLHSFVDYSAETSESSPPLYLQHSSFLN